MANDMSAMYTVDGEMVGTSIMPQVNARISLEIDSVTTRISAKERCFTKDCFTLYDKSSEEAGIQIEGHRISSCHYTLNPLSGYLSGSGRRRRR